MTERQMVSHKEQCEGVLGYSEGRYLLIRHPRPEVPTVVVMHPLQVGDRFEVRVGEQWQVAVMCSGGYRGRYLTLHGGQRMRPALCMRVRMLV